jgi:hypothetical protein
MRSDEVRWDLTFDGFYGRKEIMRYQRFKCKQCGSLDMTPINKRAEGIQSVCELVCEGCKRTTETVVYYVTDGLYAGRPVEA